MTNIGVSVPEEGIPSTRPLRLCNYCQTWNSRPCGEQCRFSLSDPTFEAAEAKAFGNRSIVTVQGHSS